MFRADASERNHLSQITVVKAFFACPQFEKLRDLRFCPAKRKVSVAALVRCKEVRDGL